MTSTANKSLNTLIAEAQSIYQALPPEEKSRNDHEQRRSFVRGMCPSYRDYDEWCTVVDRVIPPLAGGSE